MITQTRLFVALPTLPVLLNVTVTMITIFTCVIPNQSLIKDCNFKLLGILDLSLCVLSDDVEFCVHLCSPLNFQGKEHYVRWVRDRPTDVQFSESDLSRVIIGLGTFSYHEESRRLAWFRWLFSPKYSRRLTVSFPTSIILVIYFFWSGYLNCFHWPDFCIFIDLV